MSVLKYNIFFIDNELYMVPSFLSRFGVPHSEINKIVASYKYNYYLTRRNPIPGNESLIKHEAFSEEFIQKYNIPSEKEFKDMYMAEKEELKKERLKKKELERIKSEEYIAMKFDLYLKRWEDFRYKYNIEFIEDYKIDAYSKNHALLHTVLELRSDQKRLSDVYKYYIKYPDLIFAPKSYTSFANKIKDIKDESNIEYHLLHNLRNRISNNFKLSDDVVIEIKKHFCNPKKLNSAQILELVNDYLIRQNRKTISLASVQKVIATPYIKNECMLLRFGNKKVKNGIIPHAHFKAPEVNNVLWSIDGTKLQFVYKTDKKKHNLLTFFLVLDAYSKKIIGYSFGETENTRMVLEALEMACKTSGYRLPTEIVCDNSSAIRSNRMNELITYAKNFGVNWRPIQVGNSRDNSYIERFFGIFQESFCKKCNGYLGDGIKSKNLNGRPAPEEIQRFATYDKIRTKTELIECVEQLMKEYNNKGRKNGKSPNELSKDPFSKKSVKINFIKYCCLFGLTKEVTVNMGCVKITHLLKTYSYNIYEEEILLRINYTKIRVRFLPTNLKKILVFDLNNDEYIATLKLYVKISKAKIDRDKESNIRLNDHIHRTKEIQQYFADRTRKIYEKSKKNNENLPPKITEFIPSKKEDINNTSDKILSENIENLQKNKKQKKVQKDLSFFNLYTQKGTLKIIKK